MYETAVVTQKLWKSPGFVISCARPTCSLETFSIDFNKPVSYAAPFCVRCFHLVPSIHSSSEQLSGIIKVCVCCSLDLTELGCEGVLSYYKHCDGMWVGREAILCKSQ